MATNNSHIASTKYARRRKELFEITKALRDLGADAIIGRPRIAVIGGQSAGKSSLVEAVTGINVPRDSGTCTRCPMECSIRGGVFSWACQISLMRSSNGSNQSWTTTPFGNRITEKADVEINIRRAQAAILSPRSSPESFLDKSYDDLKSLTENDPQMLKFSRDVVVVDIEDPDGTDLFFVDLPGLIQNADQQAIDTVRKLVEEYIAEPETIILITIPVSDDLENQQAVRLAKAADPEGTRMIGVLTKPDTLTPGAINARKKWENVLKGLDRTHALKLGYYCVRLPEDAERAQYSREQMEHVASEYLKKTSPWSELHSTNRLGVRALVSDISELLMGIIEESIPKILAKLQTRIAECEAELSTLPEPITVDPATEILNRIMAFCRDLQDIVWGRTESKSFIHRQRAVYQTFAIAIRATAPNFQPFTDLKQYRMEHEIEYFAGELEEKDHESHNGGDESQYGGDESHDEQPATEVMGLYYVRRVIKESIGWELPRNIPYDSKMLLIKKFVDLWPTFAGKCFKDIYEILEKEVKTQITKHFGRFRRLENHITPVVRNYETRMAETCAQAITEVLEREGRPYFTQNLHYLDSVYAKWLQRYKSARHNLNLYCIQPPLPEPARERLSPRSSVCYVQAANIETPEKKVLRLLADLGYLGLKDTDLVRLHPPDNFDDELHVMADVRAYFQVAYKRIIDNLPLTIQSSLCQKLTETLQGHLINELKLGDPDASQRLSDLLVEDPRLAVKREELSKQMKSLRSIQQRLENF